MIMNKRENDKKRSMGRMGCRAYVHMLSQYAVQAQVPTYQQAINDK